MKADKNPILVNVLHCKSCDDLIYSTHRHDFVSCKCGNNSIDGGRDYLKISYTSPKNYEIKQVAENLLLKAKTKKALKKLLF